MHSIISLSAEQLGRLGDKTPISLPFTPWNLKDGEILFIYNKSARRITHYFHVKVMLYNKAKRCSFIVPHHIGRLDSPVSPLNWPGWRPVGFVKYIQHEQEWYQFAMRDLGKYIIPYVGRGDVAIPLALSYLVTKLQAGKDATLDEVANQVSLYPSHLSTLLARVGVSTKRHSRGGKRNQFYTTDKLPLVKSALERLEGCTA